MPPVTYITPSIDDWRPLEIERAGVEGPRLSQRGDVLRGDLGQRREPRRAGIPSEAAPLASAVRRAGCGRDRREAQQDQANLHLHHRLYKLQFVSMRNAFSCLGIAVALVGLAPASSSARRAPPPALVLDNARVIDGTGAAPIEHGRLVIQDDRITAVGPRDTVVAPPGAQVLDLTGRTIVPGLIDLHFHIENDPKLALRQLSHGVTSFRDPGQWEEKFVELRRMIAADGLQAPRIFTAGPHIDGEHPAYPADSVVARDPEEARYFAERNIDEGASALKIYFRLPLASARAVIDVCAARHVPCTAHLEILDARELLTAGLQGIEHITSLGSSLPPASSAKPIARRFSRTTTRGRTAGTRCSRVCSSMGPTRRSCTRFCARVTRGSIRRWRSSSAARRRRPLGRPRPRSPCMCRASTT